MKNSFKRIGAGLLALCVVLALVFMGIPSDAFASTITYSSTSNSGTRNEVCTTLDGTSASSYYTSSYTFDNLSEQSSSQLLQSLRTLMTSTHRKISSYSNCKDYANKTDCENNDGRVVLLYTSYSATMSQYNGWNREHVWPQSLGGGNTSGGGADLHHVRPSDAGVNSSRGNKKYGNSNNGTAKYGSNPAVGVLGGTYSSTYFEPLDNVKGDVARICLYVYVRWGSNWGADSITEVFQSVDVLLEWMELDPVDTWEMGRNEVVENIQGNRNVFIDYPEYAWLLFGRDVPSTLTTPSGEASGGVSSNPGGNGSSGTTATTTPTNSTIPSSSTFQKVTSLTSLATGDKVVIVAPAYFKALSTNKVGTYYNEGVDLTEGFGNITNNEIFTVTKNSDGTYSFTSASGAKLAMAAEYASLNESGTNDKWELSAASNGLFYLKNSARGNYLEWYSSKDNWSTFNPETLDDQFEIAFYKQVSNNSGNQGGSSTTGTTGTTATTGTTGTTATNPTTGTTATNPTTGTTPSNKEPAAGSTLSIKDAISLGASKAHNTYTEGKYYVKGEIVEVYNTQYGNIKIKDSSGNILTIYGTYDAKGENRYDAMANQPVVGDTITVYGIIGQYNDTPQMKNGWITKHTPASGGNSGAPTDPTAPTYEEQTRPPEDETVPTYEEQTRPPEDETVPSVNQPTTPTENTVNGDDGGSNTWVVILIIGLILLAGGGVACYFLIIRRKR